MTAVLLTVLGLVIATSVAAIGSMSHTLRDHTARIATLETAPAPRPVPAPREPVTEPIPVAAPDAQPIARVIERGWERRQNAWLEAEITRFRELTRQRTEAKT